MRMQRKLHSNQHTDQTPIDQNLEGLTHHQSSWEKKNKLSQIQNSTPTSARITRLTTLGSGPDRDGLTSGFTMEFRNQNSWVFYNKNFGAGPWEFSPPNSGKAMFALISISAFLGSLSMNSDEVLKLSDVLTGSPDNTFHLINRC